MLSEYIAAAVCRKVGEGFEELARKFYALDRRFFAAAARRSAFR